MNLRGFGQQVEATAAHPDSLDAELVALHVDRRLVYEQRRTADPLLARRLLRPAARLPEARRRCARRCRLCAARVMPPAVARHRNVAARQLSRRNDASAAPAARVAPARPSRHRAFSQPPCRPLCGRAVIEPPSSSLAEVAPVPAAAALQSPSTTYVTLNFTFASATGWFGFGVANETGGGMAGADLWITRVQPGCVVTVSDNFALFHKRPTADNWTSSDVVVTSAYCDGVSTTYVSLTRAIQSADPGDNPLTNLTAPGVSPTRYSCILISFGTPTRIGQISRQFRVSSNQGMRVCFPAF